VKSYLFCVGFGTLDGAFLKLGSTAFLVCFLFPLSFLSLLEAESEDDDDDDEDSNFLERNVSLENLWSWRTQKVENKRM